MHKFLKFIFGLKLYIFRTVPLSIIRNFYCTHSNGICHKDLLAACEQDQDVLILLASCRQTCMTYIIAVCTVKTPDDGQTNSPKQVDFIPKINFGN